MKKFLIFKEEGGSIVFVKRSEIEAFLPTFIRKNCYRIYGLVGKEKFPLIEAENIDQAVEWIEKQISIIEEEDDKPNKSSK